MARYACCVFVLIISMAVPVQGVFAQTYNVSTPAGRASVMNQFKQGKLVLDCTASCAARWKKNSSDMDAAYFAGYLSGEWEELVLLVAGTGYKKDIGYYYLGAAADGLNLPDVAKTYYQKSYDLATGEQSEFKCKTVQSSADVEKANADIHENCGGIELYPVLSFLLGTYSTEKFASGEELTKYWFHYACKDGKKFDVHYNMGFGTAFVRLDKNPKIGLYENQRAGSGSSYDGSLGFGIVEWHGQMTINYDRKGKLVEVKCKEVKQ